MSEKKKKRKKKKRKKKKKKKARMQTRRPLITVLVSPRVSDSSVMLRKPNKMKKENRKKTRNEENGQGMMVQFQPSKVDYLQGLAYLSCPVRFFS